MYASRIMAFLKAQLRVLRIYFYFNIFKFSAGRDGVFLFKRLVSQKPVDMSELETFPTPRLTCLRLPLSD